MYVEAILNEFHDVQDSAVTIMNNDNTDLANLNSIDPQKLLTALDYTPLQQVENNIEPMDLSSEYSANQELVTSMHGAYQKFCDDGKAAFDLIKQDETAVNDQITLLNSTMQSVDITKNNEDVVVYQAGVDEIKTGLSNYSENMAEGKNDLREKLGLPRIEEGVSITPASPVNSDVQTLIDERFNNALSSVNSDYNSELSDKTNDLISSLDDAKTALSNGTLTEDDIETIKQQVNELPAAPTSTGSNTLNMSPVFSAIMTDVDALPTMDFAQIETIFDNKVINPLKTEIQAEADKISTETGNTTTAMSTYMNNFGAFNPYNYYDAEAINSKLNEFGGNVSKIQEKSTETHSAYLDYVRDVYTTTNENVTTLQTNINDAYKGTVENVDARITQAKEDRSKINEINISLLKDFSGKLSYKRLGELEYTQAYDFIVNPVEAKDDSQLQTNFSLFEDITTAKQIYLVCVVLWLLGFGYLSIRKYITNREMKSA